MIVLLTLGGLLFVAFAILYPDDDAHRLQRTVRTLVASAAFCGALLASAFLAELFGAGPWAGQVVFASAADIVFVLALTLLPFAIAERVAGLFDPRRRLPLAGAAVAIGLAWSAAISFIVAPGGLPAMPWPGLIFDFALPGIAAGLAWFAFLPTPRAGVAGVFD